MMKSSELLKRLLNKDTYEETISEHPDLSILSKHDTTKLMEEDHVRNDIERLFSLGLERKCGISPKIPFEFYSHFNMTLNDIIKHAKFCKKENFEQILDAVMTSEEEINSFYLLRFLSRVLDDSFLDIFIKFDEVYNWEGEIDHMEVRGLDIPTIPKIKSYKIIDVLLLITIHKKSIFYYLVNKYRYQVTQSVILAHTINEMYLGRVERLLDLGFTLEFSDTQFDPNLDALYSGGEIIDDLKEIVDLLFEKLDIEVVFRFFSKTLYSRDYVCPHIIITTITNNIWRHGYGERLEN